MTHYVAKADGTYGFLGPCAGPGHDWVGYESLHEKGVLCRRRRLVRAARKTGQELDEQWRRRKPSGPGTPSW